MPETLSIGLAGAAPTHWLAFEAVRCLGCFDAPCRQGCPADIPIPEFIRAIRQDNLIRAAALVREANPMAAICGAVCPEEVFCQTKCTRRLIDQPIKIRELHAWASTHEITKTPPAPRWSRQVAIVGSGPAGLSCAIFLARVGIKTVVFEKESSPGGVPAYAIPDFRLPPAAINSDIAFAQSQGVEFKLGVNIDDPLSLRARYDAVFIATGFARERELEIPGAQSAFVTSALRFLRDAKSGTLGRLEGKRVAIIGGGNVSLDVASTAVELGAAEVRLLYRRGPQEMQVWRSELDQGQQRGVIIDYLTTPISFISEPDGAKLVCGRTRLKDEVDSSGRRVAIPVTESQYSIPVDLVVTSIGLVSDRIAGLVINDDTSTSMSGVFAGGDFARGEGTLVEAVRDGKLGAMAIIKYLRGQAE